MFVPKPGIQNVGQNKHEQAVNTLNVYFTARTQNCMNCDNQVTEVKHGDVCCIFEGC